MFRFVLTFALLLAAAGWAVPCGAQVQRQNENLTIFFTADVQGEVKSCGCPTLDLGGASRRTAFLDTLRGADWEFLTLDAGGILPFPPMNAQKRLKAEHMAKAMSRMQLDGIALGDWDLAQGAEYVAQLIDWLGQPVIATNVVFPDAEATPSVRSREFEVRDRRVGVLAFLDPGLATDDHAWLQVEPWEDQRDLVEELAARNDVLIAMAGVQDSTRMETLGELFPELHFIIGSHRGADMPIEIFPAGKAMAIGGGALGKYLGRAEVAFDDAGVAVEVDATFLPVVERWGRRQRIDDVVAEYNRRLRELLISGDDAGGD